jgi:hypothetical protein
MAQTGFTPLLIYSSSTGGNTPTAGNLLNNATGSELAINIADGKLFYKDSGGSVQVIAWKTTPTTAGGTGLTSYTAGDLPYYATGTTLSKLGIGTSGYFLSSTGSAPQWTQTLGVANGGTGQTSFTSGQLLFGNGTSGLNSNSNFSVSNSTFTTLGTSSSQPIIIIQPGASAPGGFNRSLLKLRDSTGAAGWDNVNYGDGANYLTWESVASSTATERMRLWPSGGLSLGNTTDPGVGNLSVTGTVKTVGGALLGTSTTALNDYREGSWTPTDASGAGLSFTLSGCTYIKIGKSVTLFGLITYPTTVSTAACLIGGLPFTQATNNYGSTSPLTNAATTFTLAAAVSQLFLRTTSNVDLTNAQMSGKFIAFSITYSV